MLRAPGRVRARLAVWVGPNVNPEGQGPEPFLFDWPYDSSAIGVPALVCASFSDQELHTWDTFDAFTRMHSEHKWLFNHRRQKWGAYYGADELALQKAVPRPVLQGRHHRHGRRAHRAPRGQREPLRPQGRHRFGLAGARHRLPGEVTEVAIPLMPSGTIFRAGETLRLVVQSWSTPRQWEGGETRRWDTVTTGRTRLHTGPDHPARLLVPVLPPT